MTFIVGIHLPDIFSPLYHFPTSKFLLNLQVSVKIILLNQVPWKQIFAPEVIGEVLSGKGGVRAVGYSQRKKWGENGVLAGAYLPLFPQGNTEAPPAA